ncbi:MAG: hypothetical protein GY701_05705 [Sulfitobacter sp.]|nr:hypothetical protein [Sulfitobacter sp.]
MEEKNEPWFPVERKLKEDVGGTERDALVNSLKAEAASTKRKMDAGVAPKEFADLDVMHNAFKAAALVVNMVWRRYHPA